MVQASTPAINRPAVKTKAGASAPVRTYVRYGSNRVTLIARRPLPVLPD
jgi:hypothetical protein